MWVPAGQNREGHTGDAHRMMLSSSYLATGVWLQLDGLQLNGRKDRKLTAGRSRSRWWWCCSCSWSNVYAVAPLFTRGAYSTSTSSKHYSVATLRHRLSCHGVSTNPKSCSCATYSSVRWVKGFFWNTRGTIARPRGVSRVCLGGSGAGKPISLLPGPWPRNPTRALVFVIARLFDIPYRGEVVLVALCSRAPRDG